MPRVQYAREATRKPLVLSETGLRAAVGHCREGERLTVPGRENLHYGRTMNQ